MPGAATAEVIFIAAMMILILVISFGSVFFFSRHTIRRCGTKRRESNELKFKIRNPRSKMPHPKILEQSNCGLVVIDVQEAFRNVIPEFSNIVPRISTAIQGFQILDVPIIVTEQYPKGLGPTAEEIVLSLPGDLERIEKTIFSAGSLPAFAKKLDGLDISQVVLCGVETHVCVN